MKDDISSKEDIFLTNLTLTIVDLESFVDLQNFKETTEKNDSSIVITEDSQEAKSLSQYHITTLQIKKELKEKFVSLKKDRPLATIENVSRSGIIRINFSNKMNTPDDFDDEKMQTRLLQTPSVKEEMNDYIKKNVISVELIDSEDSEDNPANKNFSWGVSGYSEYLMDV